MAVQFRPVTAPTDEELEYLNARNAPMRFERTLEGDLVVTPPTGSETGFQNTELVGQLRDWNRGHGHGFVLESSTGVSIGLNGAPDAGWISGERYLALPKNERKKFLPIAPELIFVLRSPSDAVPAIAQGVSRDWGITPPWPMAGVGGR